MFNWIRWRRVQKGIENGLNGSGRNCAKSWSFMLKHLSESRFCHLKKSNFIILTRVNEISIQWIKQSLQNCGWHQHWTNILDSTTKSVIYVNVNVLCRKRKSLIVCLIFFFDFSILIASVTHWCEHRISNFLRGMLNILALSVLLLCKSDRNANGVCWRFCSRIDLVRPSVETAEIYYCDHCPFTRGAMLHWPRHDLLHFGGSWKSMRYFLWFEFR